jgi:tricorn protease
MRRTFILCLTLLAVCVPVFGQTQDYKLLQRPTLSQSQICFVFGGDLWIVDRTGGDARRLTTGVGREVNPIFSPDGSQIAFTGVYEGNTDVYVVPASGGIPKRLTYHPGGDVAVGWTPDGKRILFTSARDSYIGFARFFTMAVDGVQAEAVPLPRASDGSFSPDGTQIAYCPWGNQQAWKRYRGGTATQIWISQLSDSKTIKVPRTNSNDFNPIWIGDKIYFLSDRNGPVTLFVYDTGTKKVTQLLKNDGFDLKNASAGPGAIVYEQFGQIHLFDLKSGQSKKVDIRLTGDMPEVRPRYVRVANRIASARISPTGKRAVFEARGDILTVPAEKGDARNLTQTSGVAERDPAWSPDGKKIAYFSDESGEYQLYLRDQSGMGEVAKIVLGNPPSFFYGPTWSPDSKMIAYSDKRGNLWYVDIEKRKPVLVDTDPTAGRSFGQTWSPDSKWIAFSRPLKNYMNTLFVYSVGLGKNYQVSDGMSYAFSPAFDRSGKYLYFLASTDIGPAVNGFEMSANNRVVTSSVYLVVLDRNLPSPLAPESDEEKANEPKKADDDKKDEPEKKIEESKPDEKKSDPAEKKDDKAKPDAEKPKDDKTPKPIRIDIENIGQRVLSLPIPARNYVGLAAGKENMLYVFEAGGPGAFDFKGATLHKFDLTKRKFDKVMDGVDSYDLSANGEKALVQQGDRWAIANAGEAPKPDNYLNVGQMEVRVDPRQEWKQMYHEVWRIERDFFYDPNHHGYDLKAAEKKFAPYLDELTSRADLNYLFTEMLGEMTVGHMYIGGGDMPSVPYIGGGLLGVDYSIENGRYRFKRIFNGENWNPDLKAPLTQPGVNVKEGDYLIAVNGRELKGTDDIYSFFEETAGKEVLIKVGPNPDGSGAKEYTVVPVASEGGLRHLAWIEGNRRKVSDMTGGKIAYVYLPNTAGAGYTNFNRYYFAQIDKDGVVVDERFNGGGQAADYIIDYLKRPLLNFWALREGQDFRTPLGTIFGPKAMIINESAGSGGDLMPWYFRKLKIGPLIGTRTWGGLIGIGGYPPLVDGGSVTAPHFAFYNLEGQWDIENHGVDPDIEVENDPYLWRQGHDPQLEKAVAVVMDELKKNPPPVYKRPPYPNYHPKPLSTASQPAQDKAGG